MDSELESILKLESTSSMPSSQNPKDGGAETPRQAAYVTARKTSNKHAEAEGEDKNKEAAGKVIERERSNTVKKQDCDNRGKTGDAVEKHGCTKNDDSKGEDVIEKGVGGCTKGVVKGSPPI